MSVPYPNLLPAAEVDDWPGRRLMDCNIVSIPPWPALAKTIFCCVPGS